MDVQTLRNILVSEFINPLLVLLFLGALIVFAWGIIELLVGLSSGADTKKAKELMGWGVLGLFVMSAAYAILNLIASTVGASLPH